MNVYKCACLNAYKKKTKTKEKKSKEKNRRKEEIFVK